MPTWSKIYHGKTVTTVEPFLIKAQAIDSDSKQGLTDIYFAIVDKAHRLPTWNNYPFPEQTISENVGLNTIVFRVKATAHSTSSSITYSIVSGLTPATNLLENFSINPAEGEVKVDSKLDFESVQSYKLKIIACDAAPTPNCNDMEVTVKVVDFNDNEPKFLVEGSLSVNIVEGPVTDDGILQLEARDLDISSGEVTYSISCGKLVDCSLFYMRGSLLKTKETAFDRERKTEYHREIKAEDYSPKRERGGGGERGRKSPHYFVDIHYLDKVEHLILGGTNIGAGTFAYRHGKFIVDSETGFITLSSKLDFEDVQSYQLTYAATDGVHEVTTSLIINVTNINDEAPKFSQQMYNASVIEDTVYTEKILFTVQAVEKIDPFGSIVFSLYGVPDGVFSIDSSTGDFKVNGQLDHEHKSEWKFLVVATDGDGAGLSSAVDIVIHVQDINDNVPMFLNPKYIGEIYEGRPVGTFVTRISATDADEGEYASLVYSLASSPPDDVILQDALSGLSLFNVEPSGDISALGVFDREVNSKYLIEVIATDIESNATGSCTVTINVLDLDDNKPTLVEDTFSTIISERVDIGYNVANIYAHDKDIGENAQVSFSIVKDDASSFFVDVNPVNKQNGIIRVKKNLDYQIKSVHNISIDVTQAETTLRVNVMVRLTDVNDYIPKFAERSWNISVSENTQIHSILLHVTATDSDPGFNGVIRYYISSFGTSSEMFAIHPVNGSLYLKEELDREEKDSHIIIIVATDQGSPSLSTTTTVNIQVTDVNDNSPLLTIQRKIVVSETATPPYEVVRIEAIDFDAPPNQGPFSFELVCSDDDGVCSYFALIDQHDNTSILCTKTRLDSTIKSEYTIKVRIQDSGDPPQFSIDSFTVAITPADSDSSINIIIGTCTAGGVGFILLLCGCCLLIHKQRKRCSLRKSYDVAGHNLTYQSFTLGLRGGLLRVGNANEVEMHRRKLARRSLSESDHGMHGQNSFGMEINNMCLSDDKLTTLCEENEYIDRDLYRSDSSLDMVSTLSFSVETKTSKWVDENRARTLRQHMTDYSQPAPVFTFRTQHRVFTPTYV
ncbi:cadherin-9-like [Anneissia japonica]|uniref:cadherin-9-like n=1 Tax=Anneissia japonica TaxID=1529436 RepID=UPI00142556D3|nr:cadherin-9-like [Anneissia japonica]